MSLEVRVLGDGAVFEGIESAVDGEEEDDLRELGQERGRHVFLQSQSMGLEFVTEGDGIYGWEVDDDDRRGSS